MGNFPIVIMYACNHRPAAQPMRDRFARHYADFAALWKHPGGRAVATRLDLLERVRIHKSRFFVSGWAHYLSPKSICSLPVSCGVIKAYTLSRMAGEKMRAFLSSLPAYKAKIGRRADSRRVKDLFDLARIRRHKPVSDLSFWCLVGEEFRLACKSRFIDCDGLLTFAEDFKETKRLYAEDQTFRGRIPFDEAWETITLVLQFFRDSRMVPFYFPIVPIADAPQE